MDSENIAKILDELGARMTPTAGYVWEMAVRYAYVSSLVTFAVTSALLVLIGVAWVVGLRAYRRHTCDDSRSCDAGALAVLGSGFAALIGLVLVYGAQRAFVGVLAPEYRALENLLDSIR